MTSKSIDSFFKIRKRSSSHIVPDTESVIEIEKKKNFKLVANVTPLTYCVVNSYKLHLQPEH